MSTWRDRLNGNALFILSQLIRKTCRFQVTGLEHLEFGRSAGRPLIFVAWHGMTMMLVGFFSGYYDLSSIVLIMPDDWRGGALAVFSDKLGAHPFPMNVSGDSSMSTARKLATLIRQIRGGSDCYFTPDGPDGPAYVIKPGVAYVAQKAEAMLLPVGAYARYGYRLNRWDQYTVPYPFSRISVDVGPPLMAPGKGSDLTPVIESLTDALHRGTAQAAANFYEKKP